MQGSNDFENFDRDFMRLKITWKDEIVEEVRKMRDEYAAKFDYDLDAIYKDIKKQEKKSRRKLFL